MVPDPFFINGQQLIAFGSFSTAPGNIPPFGLFFMLILQGGALPQNFFTALDFSTSNPVQTWHLTTTHGMTRRPVSPIRRGSGPMAWVLLTILYLQLRSWSLDASWVLMRKDFGSWWVGLFCWLHWVGVSRWWR